jgi:hypothetical protein
MMVVDNKIPMAVTDEDGGAGRRGWIVWLRRLGPLAFLGFFLKGMLWLIVPALMAGGLKQCSPAESNARPTADINTTLPQ